MVDPQPFNPSVSPKPVVRSNGLQISSLALARLQKKNTQRFGSSVDFDSELSLSRSHSKGYFDNCANKVPTRNGKV